MKYPGHHEMYVRKQRIQFGWSCSVHVSNGFYCHRTHLCLSLHTAWLEKLAHAKTGVQFFKVVWLAHNKQLAQTTPTVHWYHFQTAPQATVCTHFQTPTSTKKCTSASNYLVSSVCLASVVCSQMKY